MPWFMTNILLCHVLYGIHYVNSEYTLKLRLIEFKNPEQKLDNLKCCDNGIFTCKWCDPMFRICVSDKNEVKTNRDCNLGVFSTKEYEDTNNIKFGTTLGPDLYNPIIINNTCISRSC